MSNETNNSDETVEIRINHCNHCNDTWLCQNSELKQNKKSYEIWFECRFCGESEHINYTGKFGFFNNVSQKFINIAKSKGIICRCQKETN
jgi:hypothetical protein